MIERWLMNMCYKAEVQKRNEEKLNKMLRNENVPDFIQDYFLSISSRAARINYWTTIRNTLNWLIEKKYIRLRIALIRFIPPVPATGSVRIDL